MSQQPVDLRRSMRIVRRHKLLVGAAVAIGLLLGAAYSVLVPPELTATALVVLPQSAVPSNAAGQNDAQAEITQYMATQVVIAGSTPVLAGALPDVRPPMSVQTLRDDVSVSSLTSYIMSISAKGKTAGDAQATANAVAQSYISYVGGTNSPVGYVAARVLSPASTTAGMSLAEAIAISGLIGALVGALGGAVIAVAIGRKDKRLRERDDIANAIGVPVLASLPVAHPDDPSAWIRLLDGYSPTPVQAWRLRMALQKLGVVGKALGDGDSPGSVSLTVATLASDPGALALGPQLAVFAGSLGIRTVLVIGPERDTNVTAALRTACAAPPAGGSRRAKTLRTMIYDGADGGEDPDTELTIVVTVVDGGTRFAAETVSASAIVLGVTAGAASGEELARGAVIAAGDDGDIAGILVADPVAADRTTGRIPDLGRPSPRQRPNRLRGVTTETRR